MINHTNLILLKTATIHLKYSKNCNNSLKILQKLQKIYNF